MTHRVRMTARCDSGQATIEFALIIPVVIVVLLAMGQVAVVAYSQLAVTHMSREIARALAVDPSADRGRLAAEGAGMGQDDLRIETQIVRTGSDNRSTVVVRVSRRPAVLSGIFRHLLDDLVVSAETAMLLESEDFP